MKNAFRVLLSTVLFLMFAACSEDLEYSEQSPSVESFDQIKKHCITHEHMDQLMLNPEFKKSYLERISNFRILEEKGIAKVLCGTPTIIPIAVHYQGINNSNNSCLIDLAKRQIAILNNDFQGKNSDINKWTNNAASAFPGINFGETCIKFCLADKNHPGGYGLSNGQPAITINATQGDQVNQWSGYLNIFVQFGTGALGYAPYGGAGNGDGVVIEANAFGANLNCGSVSPEAPYHLGRTTTHEVGHYLLLDHIWGDGCGVDDEVSDTPNQSSDNSGCPSLNRSSCGSKDLHMNYMDYTDDACMYMFTNGQSNRMENYLNASLRNLINNASNVCSEASQNDDNDGGDDGDNPDDDVVCTNPASLSITNITENSLTLGWSDIQGALKYRIGLRKEGTTQWALKNVTASNVIYNDLMGGTSYQYRIRTQCSDGWVSWSSIASITTSEITDSGPQCETPTTINAQSLTSSTADISWSNSSDAIRYQLRYRVEGISSWIRVNTNNTSVALSNLLPNTSYQYRVRTRCVDSWTPYTEIKSFKTLASPGGDNGSGNSNYKVEITLDDYGSETSWYILDNQNTIVAEGGPYGDFQAGRVKRKDVELNSGCYSFVIEDYYGDGMCCDYGNGGARIIDEDGHVVIESDGFFGFYDEIPFCTEGSSFRLGNRKRDSRKPDLPKKEMQKLTDKKQ